jgi:glycosyltransferase involved in cell wall biosynthesis
MKKAIVIPSYRAEKTLPSVLPRTPAAFWDDGVAIIVNDKSPDNTGEVAERLKSRWPGLEVESLSRRGREATPLPREID